MFSKPLTNTVILINKELTKSPANVLVNIPGVNSCPPTSPCVCPPSLCPPLSAQGVPGTAG